MYSFKYNWSLPLCSKIPCCRRIFGNTPSNWDMIGGHRITQVEKNVSLNNILDHRCIVCLNKPLIQCSIIIGQHTTLICMGCSCWAHKAAGLNFQWTEDPRLMMAQINTTARVSYVSWTVITLIMDGVVNYCSFPGQLFVLGRMHSWSQINTQLHTHWHDMSSSCLMGKVIYPSGGNFQKSCICGREWGFVPLRQTNESAY